MPPRKFLTQPAGKRNSQETRKSKINQTLSQTTIEQSFSNSQRSVEDIEKLVNNCVRYILYRAGNNLPIRKPDIQKNVLLHVGKRFDQILNKVSQVLKDVYGYELYANEETSTKQYLIKNILPYKANPNAVIANDGDDQSPVVPDVNKVLMMLVLTHIFMSNNNVNEASLFSFLRSVNIDPDEKHKYFGNVKDFITSTMVKQKYITATTHEVTRKITYSWGPRAEHEVPKLKILEFVCKKGYKDTKPQNWVSQYQEAKAQAGDGEETMEVDDESRSESD